MREPMRDPMRRPLTRGRRLPPAALLPGAPSARPEPSIPGHLCEACLDAPAVAFVPAPWGGEMGICTACAGLPPPAPDEDATAYMQHCFDTGHPLRPGALRVRPGVRITLRGT